MKQYISEERAIYEDLYCGQFSKKLAEWAISKMKIEDAATKTLKRLVPVSADDVRSILKANGIEMPDEYIYTAWYLFNMSKADYPKSLTTDAQRAHFVEETICDPDGNPANTLDCFVTKMCNAGVPIYWERYM